MQYGHLGLAHWRRHGGLSGGQRHSAKPDTQTVAHRGDYTNAQVNAMLMAAHKSVVAFLINLLPPDLQTKVMEVKPANLKACGTTVHEAQRMHHDQTQGARG